MPERRKTGGGRFDPTDRNRYFFAGMVRDHAETSVRATDHLLIAVNELMTGSQRAALETFLADGHRVLLDSGAFTVAMDHARKHDLTYNDVFSLPVEALDGYDALLQAWRSIVDQHEAELWGYVEIDLGGRDAKRAWRKAMEAEGYRPIPVYHPLLDGWDYFDELAAEYDRICLGNISQADRATRQKLVATVLDRKRAYPGLWIHGLGLTPSEMVYAYPIDSADSSTWLTSVRWGAPPDRAAGRSLGPVLTSFRYRLGSHMDDPGGYRQGRMLGAYIARIMTDNWRQHMTRMAQEGLYTPGGTP